MVHQPMIKVIKRVEREQAPHAPVENMRPVKSAHENSRQMASTVTGWVNEFRQKRLEQDRTSKRRFCAQQGE